MNQIAVQMKIPCIRATRRQCHTALFCGRRSLKILYNKIHKNVEEVTACRVCQPVVFIVIDRNGFPWQQSLYPTKFPVSSVWRRIGEELLSILIVLEWDVEFCNLLSYFVHLLLNKYTSLGSRSGTCIIKK